MPSATDTARAQALARDLYGLECSARALPSYVDQNFHLLAGSPGASGTMEYVLKIAHTGEERATLEAQNAAQLHLRRAGLAVPEVLANRDGARLSQVTAPSGEQELVRLVSFLPGRLLVEVADHTPPLLRDLGAFLGRLDRALSDFSHAALLRHIRWDLKNAGEVHAHLEAIPEGPRRELVERRLERFQRRVRAPLDEVRQSVIHNDANDYNVLVNDTEVPATISGVIDFGDMVHTATVCELAIAMTYAMLDKPDPTGDTAPLLAGYHSSFPLEEHEIDLLEDLILTRLCVSVTLSAHERQLNPENAYVGVTEEHAWKLLERLCANASGLLRDTFHQTCRSA